VNRAEIVGQLADTADNYLHLDHMPTHVQLDSYRTCLRKIRDDLRQLYIEMTDEDPWNLCKGEQEE
jgi:hypothetical protein